jgi:surface carbohydrate biosynthesis protein
MRIALVVDNPNRDLPGLVLIAMYLCARGVRCFLVPMNLLRRELWALAPDFVLMNYLRKNNEGLVRDAIGAGIKVGVLDTEGGVISSFDNYDKTMTEDAQLRAGVAVFFCWGEKFSKHMRDNSWFKAAQIAVTGQPRFDFYAPKLREAALKASAYAELRQKPMVLVNGNFPVANPKFKTPEEEAKILVDYFNFDTKEVERWQRVSGEAMHALVKLTNLLAARFPEVDFVYRPHPFERLESYEAMLDKSDNIHLLKVGTVEGWILRSSAVIQRSCSTAVEAGLAGVPALSPRWIPTAFEMAAAEAVSMHCDTEEDMVSNVAAAIDGSLRVPDSVKKELDTVLSDWFYKVDGLAHERVGDRILRSMKKDGNDGVRLDRCKELRKASWGTSLSARLVAAAKRALGIPLEWSIRERRVINPAARWNETEKSFDEKEVRRLVQCFFGEGGGDINVMAAVECAKHDGYRPEFTQGASVAMLPC